MSNLLLDPLTERELETLQHMARNLSNRDALSAVFRCLCGNLGEVRKDREGQIIITL
jgi:DNA-binding transcriptional regulator/RsmH inhibitor MraZ